MNKEELEKLILRLTDIDIQTNGKLNDVQRVQLSNYQDMYILLKKNELLQQENQELRRNISSILNNNGFEFKNGNGELVCKLDNNLQALIKENQELKKQIEADYISVYLKACEDTKDKYKIQQKEFINYLEDGIKEAKNDRKSEWDYEIKFEINGYIDAYEEILLKYKEIVGDISE